MKKPKTFVKVQESPKKVRVPQSQKLRTELQTQIEALKLEIKDQIVVMRETKEYIEQGEDQVEMLTHFNVEADPGYYQTLVDESRAEL